MAGRNQKSIQSIVVGLLIAIVVWFLRDQGLLDGESGGAIASQGHSGQLPIARVSPDSFSPVHRSGSGWERLADCSLITGRNSDGDSFHIRHAQGESEFRIYFADAPESQYRTYRGGADNGERLAEQGAAMGGLTREETTRVGTAAKELVLNLLRNNEFEILTKWEDVYGPDRQYCLAIVEWEGREVYLHELLMAQGLARLKTRGADLPQGRDFRSQRKYLSTLERLARDQKAGAWSL